MAAPVCTFPGMGIYTDFFVRFFSSMGLTVMAPPQITAETVRLGVRHAPEMICYPYKVVLGNLIQALAAGADTILWFDTGGTCRFRHFADLQSETLRRLGFSFTNRVLRKQALIRDLGRLINRGPAGTLLALRRAFRVLAGLEQESYASSGRVKVGLVGEFYTLHEPALNHDILQRLKALDVQADMSFTLRDLLLKSLGLHRAHREEKALSYRYLPKEIGGHARESIYHALHYARSGYHGIIHLLPLTCMPETTIQPVLQRIAAEYSIPIYSFPIDENNSPAGFTTRLETFVAVICS